MAVEEEQIIKENFFIEDLRFEPEQVHQWYVTNVLTRELSHLVGWTGRASRMLRCTAGGVLKTAPTGVGIERNKTHTGTTTDTWNELPWPATVSRVDVFNLGTNPMDIAFFNPYAAYDDTIQVPAGMMYSVDRVCDKVRVKTTTAGLFTDYQVVGWW